jgi:peroxiredoxin
VPRSWHPEKPDSSLSTAEKNALAFDVCSDLDLSVARSYGELLIPATCVIDRGGTIRLAYVDADYTTGLEPATILDALRRL